MTDNRAHLADFVVGPFGEKLTRDNLPPTRPRRWVLRRKAEIAAAVRGGLVTRDEILEKYGISSSELDDWMGVLKRFD
jgi:hypothetical protein